MNRSDIIISDPTQNLVLHVKLDKTQDDYLFQTPSLTKFKNFSVLQPSKVHDSNIKYILFGYENKQSFVARLYSIYETGFMS